MTHMTHLHFYLVVTRLILCHALFRVHDTHDTFTKKSRSRRHEKNTWFGKTRRFTDKFFLSVDMIAVVIFVRLKFSQQYRPSVATYHRSHRRVDYRRCDSKLSADFHKQCHELFAYLSASR